MKVKCMARPGLFRHYDENALFSPFDLTTKIS